MLQAYGLNGKRAKDVNGVPLSSGSQVYVRSRDLADSMCFSDAQVFGACSQIKRLLTRSFCIVSFGMMRMSFSR